MDKIIKIKYDLEKSSSKKLTPQILHHPSPSTSPSSPPFPPQSPSPSPSPVWKTKSLMRRGVIVAGSAGAPQGLQARKHAKQTKQANEPKPTNSQTKQLTN